MAWRPAPSVRLGLTEASALWPNRSTASDGILGDAAHQTRPSSDHNPDVNGVVHAYDLTHDPAHGVDCGRLSAGIVNRKDPRLRYVIWNRRICKGPWSDGVMSGRDRPWIWQAYSGPNPHDHHMHVSVGYATKPENDLRPWYGLAPPEDDMPLNDTDKTWLAAKFEASERRTARYVDHGDADTTGSDDHHERIRSDIADLRTDLKALTDAVTALQPGPPA